MASPAAPPAPAGPGAPTLDGAPPTPAVPAPPALDAEETAFLGLINAYRARHGLGALSPSPTLDAAALWMSEDMAASGDLSHTDDQGRDPFQRMADFGYSMDTTAGENIACGNSSAQGTFTQWEDSPPHNANMLNASYQVIGIGRAASKTGCGWYWTTDFGG